MQDKISRRKMAVYIVDVIENKQDLGLALDQLAGYLVDKKRTREMEPMIRAIEDELAQRGTVIARVTTAHPLSSELKAEVKKLVNAKTVLLESSVKSELLGGIRIETPGKLLDTTMESKLLALSQIKM